MSNNEIVTLVVKITNYATGESIEPIYECNGMARFEEFYAWYENNLSRFHNALLQGYALNGTTPVRTMVVVKH